jgi:hypothetical protein
MDVALVVVVHKGGGNAPRLQTLLQILIYKIYIPGI